MIEMTVTQNDRPGLPRIDPELTGIVEHAPAREAGIHQDGVLLSVGEHSDITGKAMLGKKGPVQCKRWSHVNRFLRRNKEVDIIIDQHRDLRPVSLTEPGSSLCHSSLFFRGWLNRFSRRRGRSRQGQKNRIRRRPLPASWGCENRMVPSSGNPISLTAASVPFFVTPRMWKEGESAENSRFPFFERWVTRSGNVPEHDPSGARCSPVRV